MTVITGETGAGKSIIIDTLELALGGKADHSAIRNGEDSTEITISFDVATFPEIKNWLSENDFLSDEECIIRRIIRNDNRSKITINGNQATKQLARELGSMLVNIHGQHEYQTLLKPEKQLELLDSFAKNLSLRQKVKEIYLKWLSAKKELEALQNIAENHDEKLNFISYQLQELQNLDLKKNELKELHDEHTLLSNAENILTGCSNALKLAANEENNNALALLHHAKNQLEKINTNLNAKNIVTIIDLFNSAIINVEEATSELESYLNKVELNEERLAEITQRLNKIYDAARKHKIKPEELLDLQEKLKQDQGKLKDVETNLQNIKNKIAELEEEYKISAGKLSKSRTKEAVELSRLVTEKMQGLGMIGGEFSVRFEKISENVLRSSGMETISFFVSANPGMPLEPLNKVASGGELSRISLAIQVIAINENTTPVLIFDEVDVGIGGKTAEIVGKLLKSLSEKSQVICVTHLPQVASQGANHLKIEKITKNNSTETKVINLTQKERIAEIARMLGGIEITKNTLAAAEEMLKNND